MTPEQMPAAAPRVSYAAGRLTIDSQNSTLNDILSAVRSATGSQIDPPPGNGNERVAAHLTGTPREVLSSLLDGSMLGYVILGSPGNPGGIQKVILTTLAQGPAPAQSNTAVGRNPAPPGGPEPPEEDPMVMNDQNPAPPPQPGVAGQPGQPGQPPSGVVGGEQPRYGAPGQPFVPPAQSQSDGQPQVRTPDQLVQQMQQMRNRINVNPNTSSDQSQAQQ